MTAPLLRRHPLDDLLAEETAIRAVDHLDVARTAAIVTVMGAVRGEEIVLAAAGTASVRFCGPGEWMVVARDTFPDMLLATLRSALPADAFLVDQSEGRVLMRLGGPNVRRILAKGVGIDLHAARFAVGAASNALCGHVALNIARTGDNEFELIVARSLAASLFEDLTIMGREFDLSTGLSS